MRRRLDLPILGIGAALPVLIFAVLMTVLFAEEQQRGVEEILRRGARVSMSAIDREFASGIAALETMAVALAADDDAAGDFGRRARRLLDARSEWAGLALVDAAGGIVARSGATDAAVRAAPAEAALRTGRPAIGPIFTGPGGAAEAVVPIAVPIGEAARGVALVGLARAATFTERLREQEVPDAWTLAVLDSTHTIAGRTRAPEDFVGTRATGSLVEEIGRGPEGFFFALNKEGERVYTALRRSPYSNWTVALGAPAAHVEQPLRRSFWGIAGGGGAALLLALLLSVVMLRNYARRQAAERRLFEVEAERRAEQRLSDIAENFPGAIYRRVRLADGRIAYPYASAGMRELTGLDPAAIAAPAETDRLLDRVVEEDRRRWQEALHDGWHADHRVLDGRVVGAEGAVRWLRSVAQSRVERDGSVVWDGSLFDVTDRKRVEHQQAQLAAMVQTSIAAIVGLAPDGTITSWNAGAEEVYGYTAAEAIGRPIGILRPPERVDEMAAVFGQLRRGERIDHYETVRMRRDGGRIHVSLSISPVRDANGRIVGISAVSRDISDQKRAEAQQRLLLDELNHRVKNTLAVVLSIASQTMSRASSIEQFHDAFTGRVRALAEAHSLLTRTSWQAAELRAVVELAVRPYGRESGEGVRIVGPPLRLTPKPALTLTMVLHELATNAAKYGALSVPSGVLTIAWRLRPTGGDDPELELTWTERNGPAVGDGSRRGFGTALIERSIVYELDGRAELRFGPHGVTCVLRFPWTEEIGRLPPALATADG